MRLGIGLGLFKAGVISAGVRIFSAFQTRVIGDGGTVESGTCVVNGINGSALLQQASLLLIPSGYKGGKLYAEIPTNGNGDLTWTRGGDAFRTNASGVIQRVPWNLFTYSEQFNDASWVKIATTVSTNTTTSPDGNTTADTITENTATGRHFAFGQITTVSGTVYTASIYAKNLSRRYITISLKNVTGASPVYSATFDLNNGTNTTSFSGGSPSNTSNFITSVGNGWYRIGVSMQATSTSTYFEIGLSNSATPSYSEGMATYTGDGTSALYYWGAQVVEGTTAQTYLPTTDRLNFPRLSYMYGSCPAVLAEPQRTNLVLNSQNLSAATWTTNGNTVTANYATSPDGTQNATRIIPTTANQIHITYATFSVTAATSISVFVKADGYNFFQIYGGNPVGGPFRYSVVVNLSNGTIDTIDTITSSQVSIIAMNNGWYRVTISNFTTFISGSSFVGLASIPSSGLSRNANFDITYSGNGTSGALVYGVQVEQGAYPTTYIPTTSATATRVADSFSRSNIYTNGLISASGGTWFVELRGNVIRTFTTENIGGGLELGNNAGTSTEAFKFRRGGGAQRVNIWKVESGISSILYTLITDDAKVAIKWNGTSADVFVNGTKVVSATSFTATTSLEFLRYIADQVPNFIQQMALFPSALTDTQCQTLTT